MASHTGFGTPREVYLPCPQCGASPSEILKQMRTARILHCKICGTLWRSPLPARRVADSTNKPPPDAAPAEPDEQPVKLIPMSDRRKATDRRDGGFGGRRDGDVKRPMVDPRKRHAQSSRKSRG